MQKSPTELKALAQDAFEANKSENTVLVTSDGQCFLEKNRNAAENHSRKKGSKSPLIISEFKREDKAAADKKVADKKVADKKAADKAAADKVAAEKEDNKK